MKHRPCFGRLRLLPKELLKGPHHEVLDRVVNDGYMNHYSIESSFDLFRASSNDKHTGFSFDVDRDHWNVLDADPQGCPGCATVA
ncbi:MAG: hypothetical protein ACREV4_16755 [Gammaproteobacteria bacterium]